MRRMCLLSVLLVFALPGVGRAQVVSPSTDSMHVTVLASDVTRPVTVRLVSTGAAVSLPQFAMLRADTMVAMTPVDLVLPDGVFGLTIVAVDSAQHAMLRYDTATLAASRGRRMRTEWSAPVTIRRSAEHAAVEITGLRMTAEYLP